MSEINSPEAGPDAADNTRLKTEEMLAKLGLAGYKVPGNGLLDGETREVIVIDEDSSLSPGHYWVKK